MTSRSSITEDLESGDSRRPGGFSTPVRKAGGSAIYETRRRRAEVLSGSHLAIAGAEPPKRQNWNTDHWETPWELVRSLEEEFGPFRLDPAATAENRKAPCWWDEADDGLRQIWEGPVFCNPPYSVVDLWIRKAIETQAAGHLVVMVLPVRTDRNWWHDLLQPHAEIRFLRGRQRFIGPDGTTIGRPVFASCIAIFRPEMPK